jgi:membrane associated rhomboid family serine protease
MPPVALTTLHATRANEVIALLGSMGIEAEVQPCGDHQAELLVSERDRARVEQLLTEEYAEGRLQTPVPARQKSRTEFEPFNIRVLVYLFLLEGLNFFRLYKESPQPQRSDFLRNGALTWERIDQGEIWRFATAVFVHFDFVHLAANLLTLTLIGPLVTRAFGGFRFLTIFLLSGVGGNIVSHVLSPSGALKAGASGGVAGILGACAGHAIANRHQSRYRPWQMVAGVIGAYALLIGAGPRSDHLAHAGGLATGWLLGWLLAPRTKVPAEATTSG